MGWGKNEPLPLNIEGTNQNIEEGIAYFRFEVIIRTVITETKSSVGIALGF